MSPGTCVRCLVVDDDPLIRWSIVRFLEKRCLEARSAASGELALALLQEWPVDYLITEVRLPGMDGLQLVNRFPGARRPRGIILLTGNEASVLSADLDKLGVIGVIEKPLILDPLAQLLSRFLEHPTGAAA